MRKTAQIGDSSRMSGMQSDSRKTARRSSRVVGWVRRREDGGLVFRPCFFPKVLIKSRISILKGCWRMEIVLGGVTGGEGISYDFKVLRAGDNQPFSFDWLPGSSHIHAPGAN